MKNKDVKSIQKSIKTTTQRKLIIDRHLTKYNFDTITIGPYLDRVVINGWTQYKPYEIDKKPEYKGGDLLFIKFIQENFIFPKDTNYVGGMHCASFIVEKNGSLSDIKVLKSLGFNSDKEIKRVLKLSPKWKPAKNNSKNVRCNLILQIHL